MFFDIFSVLKRATRFSLQSNGSFTCQSEVSPWLSPFKIISGYCQIVRILCSVFSSFIFKNHPAPDLLMHPFSSDVIPSCASVWSFLKMIKILPSHWTFPPFQRLLCVSFLFVSLYYNIFFPLSTVFWNFFKIYFIFRLLRTEPVTIPSRSEEHTSELQSLA